MGSINMQYMYLLTDELPLMAFSTSISIAILQFDGKPTRNKYLYIIPLKLSKLYFVRKIKC